MRQLYTEQPWSVPGLWDRVEYRALEGFVFAIAPFNFTSIALNLPTAPAMLGNTVVLKPATSAVLSSWYGMQCLEAAGLPPAKIEGRAPTRRGSKPAPAPRETNPYEGWTNLMEEGPDLSGLPGARVITGNDRERYGASSKKQ